MGPVIASDGSISCPLPAAIASTPRMVIIRMVIVRPVIVVRGVIVIGTGIIVSRPSIHRIDDAAGESDGDKRQRQAEPPDGQQQDLSPGRKIETHRFRFRDGARMHCRHREGRYWVCAVRHLLSAIGWFDRSPLCCCPAASPVSLAGSPLRRQRLSLSWHTAAPDSGQGAAHDQSYVRPADFMHPSRTRFCVARITRM